MPQTQMAADEAAIREQAYYLWEQDGRPHGRAAEYWIKAVNTVAANEPTPARTTKTTAAATKLKTAASKTKAAPARSAKPADKKPKKK